MELTPTQSALVRLCANNGKNLPPEAVAMAKKAVSLAGGPEKCISNINCLIEILRAPGTPTRPQKAIIATPVDEFVGEEWRINVGLFDLILQRRRVPGGLIDRMEEHFGYLVDDDVSFVLRLLHLALDVNLMILLCLLLAFLIDLVQEYFEDLQDWIAGTALDPPINVVVPPGYEPCFRDEGQNCANKVECKNRRDSDDLLEDPITQEPLGEDIRIDDAGYCFNVDTVRRIYAHGNRFVSPMTNTRTTMRRLKASPNPECAFEDDPEPGMNPPPAQETYLRACAIQ